jgi:hypothetical protein
MVMIHPVTTFPAAPQRTAVARRAVRAPITAPVIVCVVETGMPSHDAEKRMIEPPSESLNPWCCESLVIHRSRSPETDSTLVGSPRHFRPAKGPIARHPVSRAITLSNCFRGASVAKVRSNLRALLLI